MESLRPGLVRSRLYDPVERSKTGHVHVIIMSLVGDCLYIGTCILTFYFWSTIEEDGWEGCLTVGL